MTTSEKPGTIISVASAEDRTYTEWSREVFVVINTGGEAKVESVTLSYCEWDGYTAYYNGNDDDLSEYLKSMTQDEMFELDRLSDKTS
jgi:hypothetical protein